MSGIRVTGPYDGETALSGPVSLRILEDGSATAHRLGVAEIVIAPHTEGPPQHRHGEHDEGFYVVVTPSGSPAVTRPFDALGNFRSLVMVPPGAAHTFANPGDEPAIVLNTFTPDLYIGYFRELRDQVTAGRPLSAELIGETMRRYATS